jgi:CBS domain-containing protein
MRWPADQGRHTAIGDARATGEVFLALVPLLRANGIRTLAEAEAASRALAPEREAAAGTGAVLPSSTASVADNPPVAKIDSFPYRHRVRGVMSVPPVFAAPKTTVREAVRLLIERKISSLFVHSESGEIGIATEREVLRAVDEGGEPILATPIGRIVRGPLQTVAEDDFLYRAIGRIQRMGFRHLGVTNATGAIVGAATCCVIAPPRPSCWVTKSIAPPRRQRWPRLPLMNPSRISARCCIPSAAAARCPTAWRTSAPR